MSQVDLVPWLAGFYEGEGNVRLSSRNHYKNGRLYASPAVAISQVDLEPLHKVMEAFPGGRLYGPYQYNTNKQPHYIWTLAGITKVKAFYAAIKPHLSARRRSQFDKVISDHVQLTDRPRLKTGPKPKVRVESQ